MVDILHDLHAAIVGAATGWGFFHLIPPLPLPNFSLILTTCSACIWAFCFSGNTLASNVFFTPWTSGNVIPVAFVCDHVYTKYRSCGSIL